MKKLLIRTGITAAAALLFSSMSFGQTTTTVVAPKTTGTTVVVEKKVTTPAGFKVCYFPKQRSVEGRRMVERCGPYGGCRQFEIIRTFDVRVYDDCHIEAVACSRGYQKYGWYPTRSEAREALNRCQHTISGNIPAEWRIHY